MEVLTPILQDLLYATGIALIGILAYFIKSGLKIAEAYVRTKIDEHSYNVVRDFVVTVVRSVEQSPEFKDMLGQAKKEYAVTTIAAFMERIGLKPDYQIIDKWIEEAVLTMNAIKPVIIEADPG